MAPSEVSECPFCLERMGLEDRDGSAWLVCPNGCPTEVEVPVVECRQGRQTASALREAELDPSRIDLRKPAAVVEAAPLARATGSRK